MTEGEARVWVAERFGQDVVERIEAFVDLLLAETDRQNLISPSSKTVVWSRHVVDSAQLALLAPPEWRMWLDVGTGGGFPGMIVALLSPDRPVHMAEPRRRRVEFLRGAATALRLTRATVHLGKVEAITLSSDVISARAVAPAIELVQKARHCAHARTTWLLPRGRSADDVSGLPAMFHVEHSATDPASAILVGRGTGL